MWRQSGWWYVPNTPLSKRPTSHRALTGGSVTNSQLFNFEGGAGPLPLVPQSSNNATCLTITNGLLDQTSCDPTQASGLEVISSCY